MAYTTINKSTAHFNTVTYSGTTNSSDAITGVGFQPDLVWLKSRSNAGWHWWTDAVRGVTKTIYSNSTTAEQTNADGVTAFGTDGFTIANNTDINGSGKTFVSWNWKAGNSAGSSNGDGSITSTVTANTTAGFSIVKWTGYGGTSTVGHGLGAVPKFIITKRISGDTASWHCYHASIGNAHDIYLNGANAKASDTSWNSTTPTSSVFTVNGANVNVSGTPYIAYCFAEKTGYSKFGSYTGNGSTDGTFVYCGFKPTLLLFKRTDTSKNWFIHDNKRKEYNPERDYLNPNLNATEADYDTLDILSNGFKIRQSGTGHNESGGTYIYMAIGQTIVGSNNIPCTAV